MIDEKTLEKYEENSKKYRENEQLYQSYDTDISLPYGEKMVPSLEKSNEMIRELIKKGNPFMLGRLGETELRVVMYGLLNKFPVYNPLRMRRILQRECANWCEGAGFFPKNVNLIPKFTQTFLDACKELDMLAVWYNRYEDYIFDTYAPNAVTCRFQALNMFFSHPDYEKIWTQELKGKRVLVISPFAHTIREQYKHREQIYANPNILPEFDLQTITAVQSPLVMGKSNGYKNWFQALEGMYQETLKKEYDIAILGCGAYGFPLAAKIKQSGHMAIQLCGQTQILFGIKGHRWEQYQTEKLKRVENEYWVRPGEDELPHNKNIVENGCYW